MPRAPTSPCGPATPTSRPPRWRRSQGHGVRAVAVRATSPTRPRSPRPSAETVDALGRIDICVANAGTSGHVALQDPTLDEWRRVLSVNLDGAFLTIRDCARQMIAQGDGRRHRRHLVHLGRPRRRR